MHANIIMAWNFFNTGFIMVYRINLYTTLTPQDMQPSYFTWWRNWSIWNDDLRWNTSKLRVVKNILCNWFCGECLGHQGRIQLMILICFSFLFDTRNPIWCGLCRPEQSRTQRAGSLKQENHVCNHFLNRSLSVEEFRITHSTILYAKIWKYVRNFIRNSHVQSWWIQMEN